MSQENTATKFLVVEPVPAEKEKDAASFSSAAEGYEEGLDYSEEEEARVRRIVDLRLMPWILFSTFILNICRTNISNAISAGLPKTLGFKNDVVNNAGSMYSVVFSIFAFTGSILGKRFGPHRFIPFLVFAWGVVTFSHAFIQDAGQFYLVRALLAVTQGGVIPATLVYLGSFYKKNELATRLSWFWGVQSLASAFSGIMASGLLQLDGQLGFKGWRWLFLVEGSLTILTSLLFAFAFPRSAYYTKGGLNFSGWFRNERDVKIAVTRVVRDDLLKLNYETRVQWSDVLETLKDYKVWGHLVMTSIGLTPGVPFRTYLPSIINSFGFNVYISNALTAPGYILGFITMTLWSWNSDRVGERGFHGVAAFTWQLIGFIFLNFLPDDASRGVLFFSTLIISAAPSVHPLNIAWMTENTAPLGKRTVASGLIIAFANIYGVYANQIYQPWDAPRYHVGNYIIFTFTSVTILLWINQKFLYVRLNKQRAAIWNAKSEAEKEDYNATTTHRGNDRLDFVFKH
ncbi:UNVERIFIED_CONTAM: hypothetical protein HDU68_009030 [Siphonaria sp. JEL0065]|nr:hypothetical protein HDU68_009030 [Siphonaria sp. JEL0065]